MLQWKKARVTVAIMGLSLEVNLQVPQASNEISLPLISVEGIWQPYCAEV
jgi:hypothetical protein